MPGQMLHMAHTCPYTYPKTRICNYQYTKNNPLTISIKMEPNIIEEMRKELYDTRWCKNDFEQYDVKTLEESKESFFWMVREGGTNLRLIGPSVENLFSSEANRFEIMKNPLALLSNILYWNDSDVNKYFYWDGKQLQKVSKDDVISIFNNIWGNRINQLASQYPEEYAAINKPLELKMSPEISKCVEEVKNIALELQDSSFEDCLKRLQRWSRTAVNHHIEIYGDFAKNSFGFSEVINGERRICGGIIMSQNAKEKRWSIHT